MPTTVYFGGARTDPDTAAMLNELQRVTGLPILLTQGSYSNSVAASAGTHGGGGVVDLNIYGWSLATINNVVRAGRSMGGVGWHRTVAQGFTGEHIHMVRADCVDLAAGARAQIVQYYAGQNGLANHGPDDGSRDFVGMTWGKYLNHPANSSINPALTHQPTTAPTEVPDMTPSEHQMLQDAQFKANAAYAAANQGLNEQRAHDAKVDAFLDSFQKAIADIQRTSNSAYASAGQTLNELRAYAAKHP